MLDIHGDPNRQRLAAASKILPAHICGVNPRRVRMEDVVELCSSLFRGGEMDTEQDTSTAHHKDQQELSSLLILAWEETKHWHGYRVDSYTTHGPHLQPKVQKT